MVRAFRLLACACVMLGASACPTEPNGGEIPPDYATKTFTLASIGGAPPPAAFDSSVQANALYVLRVTKGSLTLHYPKEVNVDTAQDFDGYFTLKYSFEEQWGSSFSADSSIEQGSIVVSGGTIILTYRDESADIGSVSADRLQLNFLVPSPLGSRVFSFRR